MDATCCPVCGSLAEILRRDVLESTDGPVEHAQVRCVADHFFYLPVSSLDLRPDPASRPDLAPGTVEEARQNHR
ncbi:hypothetical protein GCM10009623_15390 [Nocardioides aestuarii]|uniref:Uncharacterized protein n=1 Tax=Nocardioides aestuarii TaxID=252231 RepID=A0ABW4TLR3_9ACTN